jgi:pseudaminic acid synthase
MKQIIINQRPIGQTHPPYIIAELSGNHNGSLERAKQLILCAKQAGADAVKLQTYKPDTITLNSDREEFQIKGGLWDGYNLYKLYEWAHTPWEWHKPLFDYARSLDITIFSSAFDASAVDLLENLNTPAYKIASCELVDLPLIRYVASTGKPMIISTGMGTLEEITEAVDAAREAGCKELALLKCVSGYPAPPEEYHLNTLPDLKRRFDMVVGLSDHTLSNATAITSVALGASIIEKHITLSRADGGPDDAFSLEPTDLKQLCEDSAVAWSALGNVHYQPVSSEQITIKHRRSLYFVKNLQAGDVIDSDAIRSVRPANGLPPKFHAELIGKKVCRPVVQNSPVTWEDISSLTH